jgi:hypothetical protein
MTSSPLQISQFVAALAWLAAIVAAFAGWGALVLRIATVRVRLLSFEGAGAAIATGIVWAVFLGGLLNFAEAITRGVVVAIVASGIVLAVAFIFTAHRVAEPPGRKTPLATILCAAFIVILLVQVAATVHTGRYQNSDDMNAYLVFPQKMLAVHTFAPDPFSERRIEAQIGPGYYLQTFVLAARPLVNLQMLDLGVGLILLALLSIGVARRMQIEGWQLWLMPLATVLTPVITFNLSSVYLPYALYMGMAYWSLRALNADLQSSESDPAWLAPAMLGGLAAVMSGLKSTYTPTAVAYPFVLYALLVPVITLRVAVRRIALAAAAFLVVLLPWMIAMKLTSGTFFYPLLGHGFDYTAYGRYLPPHAYMNRHLWEKLLAPAVILAVLFIVAWIRSSRDAPARAVMALLGACFIGTLAVGWGTGGDSIRRYCYPCIAVALLLFFALWLRERNQHTHLAWGSALLVAAFAFSVWTDGLGREAYMLRKNLALSVHAAGIASPEYQRAGLESEYAALDEALPRDGVVLESMRLPFLLNFSTHDILVADYPGAAGPPPGWPLNGSGADLAQYLRANGIRYLAYSYGDCGSLPDSNARAVQTDPSVTGWVKTQQRIALLAHLQYAQLAHTQKKIYDDGSIWVLDLTQPAPPDQTVHEVECWSP